MWRFDDFVGTSEHRVIGLFSLSHEQNKARFNYAVARRQRRMPI